MPPVYLTAFTEPTGHPQYNAAVWRGQCFGGPDLTLSKLFWWTPRMETR